MMKLALAIAIACGSTLAVAVDKSSEGTMGDTTGKATAKGAGDTYLAEEFWEKSAKRGYLSKVRAARFKGADGKGVDMQKLDADGDGRISAREWTTYHQTAGASGKPAP